ncbi:multidrug resistance protein MdtA precursor [Clostridium puniceum]|uniref:Multidrug resistance protein MdtA n=1 Tax=Clostridium puniceum TaxID=29367 RepID=A0A1S8TCY8_9CLOT|nr:efflux RND transporter periplasmic adaptor subunit [Clostridium puniceum]OOM75598.1 multidrug resistance protein MdtA precursor [Clostridium puniceum]
MKKIKKIVIFAVVIVAVIGAIVVKNNLSSSAKKANVAVTVSKTAVEVQSAKAVQKNSSDTYKATLEASEQGIINSKISARVISVSVENGQHVKAGDVIVTLDAQDIQNNIEASQSQLKVTEQQLNSAQVSLKKFKTSLDDANRNYERQKALYEKGGISKADYEAAEKTLTNAQADYEAGNVSIETSKANIEVQKVSIANLQDSLNNTVIKAPISGVISDKSVNIGQMASQGTALAKVNNIAAVYATIQIPQDKINNVKVGQAATVTFEGSDQSYSGAVQNINLSADTTARVFECKIKLDNSDNTLYPGTFAKVELFSDQKTEIITVPINALVGSEGDYSVFINDNGVARKQKATIGETEENNVQITSGIKDGDEIICTNTSTLQDGDEVEIVSNENSNDSEESSKQNGDNAEAVSK